MEHFSPHQFGVTIHDESEIMVHGVWAMSHLHLDWVVLQVDVHNAFNLMSWSAICQKLQSSPNSLDQIFPFVWQFYACSSPLYFFQAFQHGDLIILLKSCTQQNDPLGGTLFALVHLHSLCFIVATHLTCVFPLLVDDMHIISPTSNVVPIFLQLYL
jgi:hypothetical protein